MAVPLEARVTHAVEGRGIPDLAVDALQAHCPIEVKSSRTDAVGACPDLSSNAGSVVTGGPIPDIVVLADTLVVGQDLSSDADGDVGADLVIQVLVAGTLAGVGVDIPDLAPRARGDIGTPVPIPSEGNRAFARLR